MRLNTVSEVEREVGREVERMVGREVGRYWNWTELKCVNQEPWGGVE